MKKTLLSTLTAAILLSGCATTGSDRNYVVKVNGVETNNPKNTFSDVVKYVALAGIAGTFSYLGYRAIKGKDEPDPPTQEQIDRINDLFERRAACEHLLPDYEAFNKCVFD